MMQRQMVKELMTRKVITATPNDKLKDVIKKLADNDISGLPVIDEDNKVIGMISESDILQALKTESRTLSMIFPSSHALGMTFEESIDYRELREAMKDLQNSKIEKIMNTNVISVEEDIKISQVATIMVINNINRIPVVKNNKLVGIITRGDIIDGLSKFD